MPSGWTIISTSISAPPLGSARSAMPSVSLKAFGALGSAFGMLPVFWVIAAIGFGGGVYGGRHRPRRREASTGDEEVA